MAEMIATVAPRSMREELFDATRITPMYLAAVELVKRELGGIEYRDGRIITLTSWHNIRDIANEVIALAGDMKKTFDETPPKA